jgi:hypothetical protein
MKPQVEGDLFDCERKAIELAHNLSCGGFLRFADKLRPAFAEVSHNFPADISGRLEIADQTQGAVLVESVESDDGETILSGG